jgi:hypothetical protein
MRSVAFRSLRLVAVIFAVFSLTARSQVASGGSYTLEQTVVPAGGGSSAGASYGVDGTIGQSPIGNSTGPQYSVRGGFWVQAPFAPTAANASISGRVIRENGLGLKGVQVVLIGGTLTAPQTAITGSLGYFTFEEVQVGQSYVLSVSNKKYGFAEGTRVFTLTDNLSDIVFEATWVNS